jgi:hypothetical protein
MKRTSILLAVGAFSGLLWLSSCGSEGVKKDEKTVDVQDLTNNQPEEHGTELKESDIQLTSPLNQQWVSAGKTTYELKCQSCHRLNGEKLVGPGWKDITKRRTPLWIMNMITNVDMMLDTDAEAQKLLEQCMVRMPNLHLSTEQAREVLEYMRQNDGEK